MGDRRRITAAGSPFLLYHPHVGVTDLFCVDRYTDELWLLRILLIYIKVVFHIF